MYYRIEKTSTRNESVILGNGTRAEVYKLFNYETLVKEKDQGVDTSFNLLHKKNHNSAFVLVSTMTLKYCKAKYV